jgi:hypothetical protein
VQLLAGLVAAVLDEDAREKRPVCGVSPPGIQVQVIGVHSIAERQGSPTALFWDELAGHAVWYVGLSLLLGAPLSAGPSRPDPVPCGWCWARRRRHRRHQRSSGHAAPLAVGACLAVGVLAASARGGLAVDVPVAAAGGLRTLAVVGLIMIMGR